MKKIFTAAQCLVLSTALVLAGCGSTPTKPDAGEEALLTTENIEAFIADTQTQAEPERSENLLLATEFLIDIDRFDQAHSVVDSITLAQLNDTSVIRLMLARARIAIAEGEPYLAQRYLFNERVEAALPGSETDPAIALLDLRATLMYNFAEYLSAFESRVQLEALLDDEAMLQLNHDLIWEALAEIPTDTLFDLAKSEKDSVKEGWYSLAALSKSNGANFRKQITDINKWREIWPSHPANRALPADLQLILQLADEQARQIAVLLPQTGSLASAGSAIREGLLAAYYDDASLYSDVPVLRFYDSNTTDINTLYDQAVLEGAELVIGPLEKDRVEQLSQHELLPVAVLALNTLPSAQGTLLELEENNSLLNLDDTELSTPEIPRSALYQFGLAVETEAEQIAEKAWQDGHRRVLLLAPDSSWGNRGATAFRDRWLSLGGSILDDHRYLDQRAYSELIENAVGVRESKQRRSELQQILATNLHFEPRRRKDIDFIYLQSNADIARQLKPLLAFHYAGDVPVYATSQIFLGNQQHGLNDLNGVRFVTMPWFFDDQASESRAIQAYSDNVAALQSLYAMGVDAYHIYPRLPQLREISQAQFYGATGKLRVGPDNILEREQIWAHIREGRAEPLSNQDSHAQ